MKHNETIQAIQEYFNGLSDNVFPDELKPYATVVLSGSTGWGIEEGFDKLADWDLHIFIG
ncbi:hypothetical protein BBF96_13755 [Anoxybacter fermentans]|uniref:Polymerase nucleotidyl transferase domain-containing protein n=1 Tax=Anoxybacter fermentans TaxID=1323375 RepID=A0A3S9T1F3_9FIRM|nr:hypothetical protein [Anoxybacter fermentans]AZR74359.1 hypothetical protein BBF96_13755 [Anoxybacter fermentans]